jgi:hypothetical protein
MISTAMLGLAPPSAEGVYVRSYVQILLWGSLAFAFIEPSLERGLRKGLNAWGTLHFTLRGLTYAGLLLAVIFFGGSSQKFIYFDF